MKLNLAIAALVLTCATSAFPQDQTPALFGEPSLVVVGTQKIETLYTFATGKWSDTDEKLGLMSAEIHCYKKLGFCSEAEAHVYFGQAQVVLTELDILRWDDSELIAVDSTPICEVNTIRFDFRTKQISYTIASKGVPENTPKLSKQICGDVKPTTTFLGGGFKHESVNPKSK
jgi:hypothetical protein